MIRFLTHILIVLVLTLLSQLGGVAWLIALLFKRRALVFVLAYAGLSFSALQIAPMLGRVPLPCAAGETLQMQSAIFCLLNRQYVVPELKEVLDDLASGVERDFPGTTTLVLDANFPFIDGFPLLPHLSHDDGRKVDIAFYYSADGAYLPKTTKSPVGYFAFEDGDTICPQKTLTLRWNFSWLQGLWPNYRLELERVALVLNLLSDDNRINKVFVEPHLQKSLNIEDAKIRFQGCRAARHDDHIHIQL